MMYVGVNVLHPFYNACVLALMAKLADDILQNHVPSSFATDLASLFKSIFAFDRTGELL